MGTPCVGVGRPGSGALPPPTTRPFGRAAGAHYPLAVGAGFFPTHCLWVRGLLARFLVEFVGSTLATTSSILVAAEGLVTWRFCVQWVAIHLGIILTPGLTLSFSTLFTEVSTRFSTSFGPS